MSDPEFDLLGDPMPEPLPSGLRFGDAEQLQGHTIAAVFDTPTGRFDSDMVIVTATRCWIVFKAEVEGCGEDGAYLDVTSRTGYRGGKPETLHDYVSANELLREGCIQQGEFDRLKAVEVKREVEAKERRAARLRADLAQLEGGGA